MKTPLVIFGIGQVADVVFTCFRSSSNYQVVAFTCDREHLTDTQYHGLPVCPFEEIEKYYPPNKCKLFVAIGYQDINRIREEKIVASKAKNYQLATYYPDDLTYRETIELGENCFIMDGTHIQPHVEIGNNVFIWSGAIVGHHSQIKNNVWITSGANLAGKVKLGKNCIIAINATIGNDVSIGDECFIGANALVTKNISNQSVVIEKSSELFRLNTEDFLRVSQFH